MSSASPKKIAKLSDRSAQATHAGHPLHACIHSLLTSYFSDLDGHPPGNLFDLVMDEVERPLLETVLHHTRGNQSKAAEILGLNRGTLRKKLRKYDLD
jgi:Fis family transcriptional regulator, factor for inversion stimulation protein